MKEKIANLKKIISDCESVVIAFSGGVDSTMLAAVTADVLPKENILLITANTSTFAKKELLESKQIATTLGLRQEIIGFEELDVKEFSDNSPERCYYCKRELFCRIKKIARERGHNVVFEGSNKDDLADYRPGLRAVDENGIRSPLREAQLTKDEIRQISAEMSLATASKPAMACLASRFPYGEKITKEKLQRVGFAEEKIASLGFRQFRVRSHNDLARVEVEPSEMNCAWEKRDEIALICKKAGFIYSALDFTGYRSGAMNEVL
ncbi:potassium-transporting ATPase subunit A [Chitinispirillum alkaliphilum]|nr:potassium-transporting ATPase subunit A [Chitinispirillum alkaliphilum]